MTTAAAPTSTPELASRLRLAVTRMGRRLRQQQGEPFLSPSLSSALATIERRGPLAPSELADAEGVQRPSVTRILARLEADGLVVRVAGEHDRRTSRIEVTPAGRKLLKRLRTRKTAYLARRLERLDAEERELLERAAEILERMLAEDA
jgi:DNA-binding MarR family transcriptional regulator